MAEKMGQQLVPCQHLTGFQWVPVENPFRCRSVAIRGFLEDGTSFLWCGGYARSSTTRVLAVDVSSAAPAPVALHREGPEERE